MALGTGEHTIAGKTVNVTQARRAALGGGGLVQQGLTVQLKRGGVGATSVKTGSTRLGAPKTTTLIRRPKLTTGSSRRPRRASTARPVLGPMGTRSRGII